MARMANVFGLFPSAHARQMAGFNNMFHAQRSPYSFAVARHARRFAYEDEALGEFCDTVGLMVSCSSAFCFLTVLTRNSQTLRRVWSVSTTRVS